MKDHYHNDYTVLALVPIYMDRVSIGLPHSVMVVLELYYNYNHIRVNI